MEVKFDWGIPRVQILNSVMPLNVRIVGGASGLGGNSPLTNGLEGDRKKLDTSVFDQLPKQFGGFLGAGEKYGRAIERGATKMFKKSDSSFVSKNAGTMGAGVGMAAGLFVGALQKGKEIFIDPLINAATGGFQTGLNRGMGVETFGKVFEVLGMTIGVSFLPHVIEASANVLRFADALGRNTEMLDGFASGLVDTEEALINPFRVGPKATFDMMDRFLGYAGMGGKNGRSLAGEGVDIVADGLGLTGTKDWFRRQMGYEATADGKKPMPKSPQSDYAEMIVARLKRMEGGQASYSGIADVREQAQLAALNTDPLDAKIKRMLIEKLESMSADISAINGNTKAG